MAKITEAFIRRLTPTGSRHIIADDHLPGFAIRVGKTGAVSYIYRYRIGRNQHTYTIGSATALTAAQARQEAKRIAGLVALGSDPNSEKRSIREAPQFKELAQDYLKLTQKRALRDDRSKIERTLVPRWGNRRVDSLTTKDVRELLKDLADHGYSPATINRYRSLLSTMFNRAVEWEWIKTNPVSVIKPLTENNKRTRYLSEEELTALFDALQHEPSNSANCIKMMLFTGARRGDVMRMRWSDVDFERGQWRIPSPKPGKSHTIPLNADALSVLREQEARREVDNPYVFPGRRPGTSLTTVQQTWGRVLKAANISDMRLHDLRHTFASYATMNGVDLYHVSKLLGHHSPVMTARYAHLRDEALRRASAAAVNFYATERGTEKEEVA